MGNDAAIQSLHLAPALDSNSAAQLFESLRALRGAPLAIDAGDVAWAGSHCLQVLLAAAMTWKSDGIDFRIASCSREFAEAAALLGLTQQQLPMELPPQ